MTGMRGHTFQQNLPEKQLPFLSQRNCQIWKNTIIGMLKRSRGKEDQIPTCWLAPQLEVKVRPGVSDSLVGRVRCPLDRLSLRAAPVLWYYTACSLHR